MPIDLDSYNTVPERIAEFADKHPDGSLQQVDIQFVNFGGADWIVYTAAAYRTAEDQRPGMGTAWERVPGLTPYTKNSEMQNAETSAWGRAIVAALAADTRKAPITTMTDVQNRQAERDPQALRDIMEQAYKALSKAELLPLYHSAVSLGVKKEDAEKLRAFGKGLPENLDPADPNYVAGSDE